MKNQQIGGVARLSRALIGCGLALLCACAHSAVPSLGGESFTTPVLAGLAPRELDIAVRDERSISPEERRATEQHISDLLEQILRGTGVSVSEQAPHRLEIAVRQPERTGVAIHPSSCVEMRWELQVLRAISASSTSVGCSEWRNAEGAFASDVSAAFRQAVEMQLARLDGNAAELIKLAPPLAFETAEIEVPSFTWLRPRTLTLQVADELSADGAPGSELRGALEAALASADVRVTDAADYRLALKLSRPARASTDMERRICVSLSADLSGPSGRRFSSRDACPSRDAPLGTRLVNEVLLGLDSPLRQ